MRELQEELRRLMMTSWTIAQVIKVVKMDGKNKAIVKVDERGQCYALGKLAGFGKRCGH